jgi:hypothetical protein
MEAYQVIWTFDGSAVFGAATSTQGNVVYRLIVEELPSGGAWDWSVWRTDKVSSPVGHGTALSHVSARASAEEAARAWDAVNDP